MELSEILQIITLVGVIITGVLTGINPIIVSVAYCLRKVRKSSCWGAHLEMDTSVQEKKKEDLPLPDVKSMEEV